MFHLEKDKPIEVAKYLQKLYLLYPRDDKSFKQLLIPYISLITAVGLPHYTGMIGFAYKGFIDNIGIEWLENIEVIALFTTFVLFSCSYVILGEEIKKLVQRIHEITSEVPVELVRTYVKMNKNTWIVYFGMLTLMTGIAIINFCVGNYCDGQAKKDKRYACGLLNPGWFPFQVEDTGMRKIILTLVYDMGQILFNPIFTVTTHVVILVPSFLVAHMQHLRKNLEEINASNLHKFTRDYKYYVHYYSEICGCVQDLKNSIGYCYFFGYTLLSVLMAFSGYVAVIRINLSACSILIGAFLFGWLFCGYGQNFEDEHENLIRCISSIPWYKMNAKTKQNYSLFLGMVQCPIHVRIMPLGFVNYVCLLSIYSRAYTIITFLVNTSVG